MDIIFSLFFVKFKIINLNILIMQKKFGIGFYVCFFNFNNGNKKMIEIPFDENDAHYWKRYY